LDKESVRNYLRASIKERDEIGRIEFAERNAEKKGEIKGKIEGKIEVAKSLKLNGIDVDIIAKTTGLTKEEIERL
jgi:predicted transposase/invertase (TIGR01784 family)